MNSDPVVPFRPRLKRRRRQVNLQNATGAKRRVGLCHTVFVLIALLLLLAVPMVAQEQQQAKPPKPPGRGDLVEARGCVKGGVLESSELSKPGSEDRYTEFTVFRLTGDKKVLEGIRKEHDGHSDVIRGELRTDLPKASQTPGMTVGNTRITIGVKPGGGRGPEPAPPMPVLKATGIEHTGVTCRPSSTPS